MGSNFVLFQVLDLGSPASSYTALQNAPKSMENKGGQHAPINPQKVKASNNPTPAPATVNTPIPDLMGVSDATLNPLPNEVRLKESIQIPIVINGKKSGTMTLPSGSKVQPISVNGNELTIRHAGDTTVIPLSSVDL